MVCKSADRHGKHVVHFLNILLITKTGEHESSVQETRVNEKFFFFLYGRTYGS